MANQAKPTSSASFALIILFAINLLNFFDRQLAGALAEPVRKEFMLSDTALGLLGTVFTLMYAIVGLPLGRIADKWYRTRLLAIGTGVWSLLTAASGLAQNYTQLFISRLGVGLGEATCAPAGQSLIGDLFPPRQRARAMGLHVVVSDMNPQAPGFTVADDAVTHGMLHPGVGGEDEERGHDTAQARQADGQRVDQRG